MGNNRGNEKIFSGIGDTSERLFSTAILASHAPIHAMILIKGKNSFQIIELGHPLPGCPQNCPR
jgi:hypothetical protein